MTDIEKDLINAFDKKVAKVTALFDSRTNKILWAFFSVLGLLLVFMGQQLHTNGKDHGVFEQYIISTDRRIIEIKTTQTDLMAEIRDTKTDLITELSETTKDMSNTITNLQVEAAKQGIYLNISRGLKANKTEE